MAALQQQTVMAAVVIACPLHLVRTQMNRVIVVGSVVWLAAGRLRSLSVAVRSVDPAAALRWRRIVMPSCTKRATGDSAEQWTLVPSTARHDEVQCTLQCARPRRSLLDVHRAARLPFAARWMPVARSPTRCPLQFRSLALTREVMQWCVDGTDLRPRPSAWISQHRCVISPPSDSHGAVPSTALATRDHACAVRTIRSCASPAPTDRRRRSIDVALDHEASCWHDGRRVAVWRWSASAALISADECSVGTTAGRCPNNALTSAAIVSASTCIQNAITAIVRHDNKAVNSALNLLCIKPSQLPTFSLPTI